MFVTTSAMRMQLASALFTDVDVWGMVELELQIPLLLIGIADARDGSTPKITRTFFAQPTHLERFIAAGTQVGSVDLLSPARMNGNGRWTLEPLQKLWKCAEPTGNRCEWLYQVRDGREYCQSALGTAPDALHKRDCVFSAPASYSQTTRTGTD